MKIIIVIVKKNISLSLSLSLSGLDESTVLLQPYTNNWRTLQKVCIGEASKLGVAFFSTQCQYFVKLSDCYLEMESEDLWCPGTGFTFTREETAIFVILEGN